MRLFLRVTLPWLYPAMAGAAVLALLESFDDFLRSFFLGGYQPTLPVLIYGRLFFGLSPEINAIASIVLVMTISVGLAGERLAATDCMSQIPHHRGTCHKRPVKPAL